jgi:D-serine deaminase-like pyridoxal phosphate-dependent protein
MGAKKPSDTGKARARVRGEGEARAQAREESGGGALRAAGIDPHAGEPEHSTAALSSEAPKTGG